MEVSLNLTADISLYMVCKLRNLEDLENKICGLKEPNSQSVEGLE